MSSPAAPPGPASVAMASQASRSTNRPTTANGVGPSTPAATGNVSTPRSNATPSTMANASFLSPSAGRIGGKHLGKSPATGATGTPTPALGSGESPALMGLDPGASNMSFSMSNLGLGMGIGLSGSGLGGSSTGKLDDAERHRRLEVVLASLDSRTGVISQEAVSRLGRKWGLELYEEVEDKKLLTLGGTSFAVDLYFETTDSPDVDRVALHFHGLCDGVVEHAPKAAKILQEDLKTPKDISRINYKLAGFANNLERLARLDKLSITGASCFEAVTGVYTSLRRLYEYEKSVVGSMRHFEAPNASGYIDREIICNYNGIPRMHARERVGLVLDYWMYGQHLSSENGRSDRPTELDDSSYKVNDSFAPREKDQIHSAVIECEYCLPGLYPPMRVSSDWLAISKGDSVGHEPIEGEENGSKFSDLDAQANLQWLDPPAPQISTVEPNPMAAESTMAQTQAHARFVARLEPPVVLPLQAAIDIYASIGIDLAQDPGPTTVWDSLLLYQDHDYDAATNAAAHSSPFVPRARHIRHLSDFDENLASVEEDSQSVIWETRLHVNRPELAIKMDKIPFSHPRQILDILPKLRQHIMLGRLLKSCFAGRPDDVTGKDHKDEIDKNGSGERTNSHDVNPSLDPPSYPSGTNNPNIRHHTVQNGTTKTTNVHRAPRDRMIAMMDGERQSTLFRNGLESNADTPATRLLDVTLSHSGPNPRLSVKLRSSSSPEEQRTPFRLFRIDLLPNGMLHVTSFDNATELLSGHQYDTDKMSKALSTCEDLCIWAEWLLN